VRRQIVGTAAGALVALGALTACSPAQQWYAGGPSESGTALDVNVVAPPNTAGVILPPPPSAITVGQKLVLTVYGSSSCPPVPHIDGYEDGSMIVNVSLGPPSSNGPCTADIGPSTFELETDRDLDGFSVQVTI
jgi:hypothetical protein